LKKVTIKDVAKVAGVSHITVSRVLHNSELVRPETKKTVSDAIHLLNYVPDFNARGLVSKQSHTIGLFFSTLKIGTSANFFHNIVLDVFDVMKNKYNVVLHGIDECLDFEIIKQYNFDGILVFSQRYSDDQWLSSILDIGIPIVVMNQMIYPDQIVSFVFNDEQGAYDAAKLLFKNGHKQIAIIEGPSDFPSSKRKKQGVLKALQEVSLSIPAEYCLQGDYTFLGGYHSAKKILTFSSRPTAVFCFNDNMALGAYRAIMEAGLQIPADISVIGFDGSTFAEYATPVLTTVNRPISNMSRLAAENMLQILKKPATGITIIPTKLVAGKSVKNLYT